MRGLCLPASILCLFLAFPTSGVGGADAERPRTAGETVVRTPSGYGEETVFFVRSRAFRGQVRREMAEYAAIAAARMAGLESAMRELAAVPDVRFLAAGASAFPSRALDIAGLARAVYAPHTSLLEMRGFPPDVEVYAHVRLVPPAGELREAVREALAKPVRLEFYGRAVARYQSLLETYDRLAKPLLTSPAPSGRKEDVLALEAVVRASESLDVYLSVLPRRNGTWEAPEDTLALLEKALALDPHNPLVLTALAEVLLQLDKPSRAMEHAEEALRQDPTFARTHDIKGAIFLRQHLPALAAQSFSQALRLVPEEPVYRLHRASAYLVLEEIPAMCEDFQTACLHGECEGLAWARSVGMCLRETGTAESEDAPASVAPAPDAAGGSPFPWSVRVPQRP